MKIKQYLLILCLSLCHLELVAQFDFPPLSAKGQISQVVGYTQVEIEYERPSARNRKIFGGLVPWNKVWRTGAGYCTKITVSEEVQIGKQRVPAGTYSLFSIPNPDNWVIILNTDTSLYGSYDYDLHKDVARFQVPVETTSRYYETLTIDIDVIPNNARIYVSWEHVSLHFDLKTTTDAKVMRYITEELMTGKIKDHGEYAMAADYFIYQGENLHDALTLTNTSIELGGKGFPYRLKMDLLENFMRYSEAIEVAELGLAWAKVRPLDDEKWREQGVRDWQVHIDRLKKKEAEASNVSDQ